MNQIIMNINDFEERAALLEDGKLSEIFIQRNQQNRINGNIYKGRVVNILPGMEAAFLDIGLEKNAFLHKHLNFYACHYVPWVHKFQ